MVKDLLPLVVVRVKETHSVWHRVKPLEEELASDSCVQGSSPEEQACEQALEGPAGSPQIQVRGGVPSLWGSQGEQEKTWHVGEHGNSVQPPLLPGGQRRWSLGSRVVREGEECRAAPEHWEPKGTCEWDPDHAKTERAYPAKSRPSEGEGESTLWEGGEAGRTYRRPSEEQTGALVPWLGGSGLGW